MSKAGYGPGKGRTFTPSITAKWTESFNELLESESGISRNSLTEKLIEEGIKARAGGGLSLPLENLTSDQIALLESKAGKQILINVALMLLGNEQGLNSFQAIDPVRSLNQENIFIEPEAVPEVQIISEPINNTIEKQEIPTNKIISEKPIEKSDAKQKLLEKMGKLNKTKNNL